MAMGRAASQDRSSRGKQDKIQRAVWTEDETREFEKIIAKYGNDWDQLRKNGNGIFDKFTDKQLCNKLKNMKHGIKKKQIGLSYSQSLKKKGLNLSGNFARKEEKINMSYQVTDEKTTKDFPESLRNERMEKGETCESIIPCNGRAVIDSLTKQEKQEGDKLFRQHLTAKYKADHFTPAASRRTLSSSCSVKIQERNPTRQDSRSTISDKRFEKWPTKVVKVFGVNNSEMSSEVELSEKKSPPLFDIEVGSQKEAPRQALESHSSFPGRHSSDLLLLTELSRQHQLMSLTIQKLIATAQKTEGAAEEKRHIRRRIEGLEIKQIDFEEKEMNEEEGSEKQLWYRNATENIKQKIVHLEQDLKQWSTQCALTEFRNWPINKSN